MEIPPFKVNENLKKTIKNKASLPKNLFLDKMIRILIKFARKFENGIPNKIKKIISEPLFKVLNNNQQAISYPHMPPEIEAKLEDEFKEDILHVKKLLNRQIYAW